MITSGGLVGIGATPTAFQLQLSTDNAFKLTSPSWATGSDERLKEDIVDADLNICYDNIKNLKLKYYKWKEDVFDDGLIKYKHKIGWIAQDVLKVLPKAVDCMTLNTDLIYATMSGAIQK